MLKITIVTFVCLSRGRNGAPERLSDTPEVTILVMAKRAGSHTAWLLPYSEQPAGVGDFHFQQNGGVSNLRTRETAHMAKLRARAPRRSTCPLCF